MSLRLTNEEIKNFLVGVCRTALTTVGYTNPRVITSHQNAPAPQTPYITVEYTGIGRRIGEVTKGDLTEIGETGVFEQTFYQDNEKVFTITEEGGDGSMLELIKDSMELTTIRDLFQTNNIALMRIDDVIPKPSLFNDDWIRASTMDIILGIASGVKETSNYIEKVNMTGEVKDPE